MPRSRGQGCGSLGRTQHWALPEAELLDEQREADGDLSASGLGGNMDRLAPKGGDPVGTVLRQSLKGKLAPKQRRCCAAEGRKELTPFRRADPNLRTMQSIAVHGGALQQTRPAHVRFGSSTLMKITVTSGLYRRRFQRRAGMATLGAAVPGATLIYTSSHVCLTDRSNRRSSGLPSNTMRPCPMT